MSCQRCGLYPDALLTLCALCQRELWSQPTGKTSCRHAIHSLLAIMREGRHA